jgi:hypothetical protein
MPRFRRTAMLQVSIGGPTASIQSDNAERRSSVSARPRGCWCCRRLPIAPTPPQRGINAAVVGLLGSRPLQSGLDNFRWRSGKLWICTNRARARKVWYSFSRLREVSSIIHANNYSMEVRSDPFESAKSHFFDTSSWGPFCDVTLTLKQGRQSDSGAWVKINDYPCRQAFRPFMNLLNRAVYGAAFRRYGKRLRVLPVLEKGEVRARA